MFISLSIVNIAQAFKSDYPCSDTGRYCTSSGMRKIDGFEVSRPCWEYSYSKKCNYPSKNNCSQYSHCYFLGQQDCLLKDSLGNCVNILKEFSCKRWVQETLESEKVRYGLKAKDGREGIVCNSIACIDGNCLDKSYEMNEDMVRSISYLGALSQGRNTGISFKIFEGAARHCSKKPVGYSNCCKVNPKGWGRKLGAKCSKDEEILSDLRSKNLCVYVGKKSKKKAKVTTLVKHYFCCFSNMLEKIIQVQGRSQLGLNFGYGGNTNCRGLTLEELERIDWERIDFSEVAAEIYKNLTMPDVDDIKHRIRSSYERNIESDESNAGRAGINKNLTE